MKRALTVTSLLLGILLISGTAVLLWTYSGRLSEDQLAGKTSYSTDFAPADRDTFTVMTYNLGHLAGASPSSSPPNRHRAINLKRATNLIRQTDPDVVGLQNIGLGTDQASVHPLDTLASRLTYPNAVRAVGWDKHALFPFTPDLLAARPEGTVSGQALLSHYPTRRHLRRELPDSSALWTRLSTPEPLVVMNAHLSPSPTAVREQQARQLRWLYGNSSDMDFRSC